MSWVQIPSPAPILGSLFRADLYPVKKVLIILALLTGVIARPAFAEQDLTADQVEAYKAVVKADLARDSGAIAEAQRLYREAMDLYNGIAQKDPNWHPEIVQFRLSYCRSQAEALKGRAEGELPPEGSATKSESPDVALAEAQQRVAQLEAENQTLRTENEKAMELQSSLQADMEAVQKARLEAPELSAAREEIRGLLEQVAVFSNQLVAVELQYQAATGQLAEARSGGEELEKQLKQAQKDTKEIDKLRDERDQLQKDLKSARENAKKKRDELIAASNAEWEQAKVALETELKECRDAREALTSQLKAATEQLAGAAPAQDDAIPKLKADLEQARNALEEVSQRIAESRTAALELLKPATHPAP